MATLVLSVAGGVVGGIYGGPVGAQAGAALGAAIGGVIDNLLFAKSQKVEGPRLDDLTVNVSTYGAPIPIVYGPENRVGVNVIWATDLLETENEESVGKGGGGSSTTYTYRVSLAASISEGRSTNALPKRIYANGKKIFDIDEATLAPDAPTTSVGMVATLANGTHAVFDTMRFYQGNGTQQIDPTIESYLGVDNTPAFRHTMYIVLVDLQLADFGNSIPNIEIEVAADESTNDAAIVDDILSRCNVGVSSTSALVGNTRRGYVVSRPGTAAAVISPLALVGLFDVAEQRGQLRCIKRGRGMKGTIPISHTGAQAASKKRQGKEPVEFVRISDFELPNEAVITYTDPAQDYQKNSQQATRDFGNSENKLSHDVAITMSADEARQVADRLLWEAWAARATGRFALSDRWVKLNSGDVVSLPIGGNYVPHKVQRMSRGANGVIDVEVRAEDPVVYESEAVGDDGNVAVNEVLFPGTTELVLLDMPILRSIDDDEGYYWSVTGASDGWRGAQVYRSVDSGTTYNLLSNASVKGTIGTVATALPSGPADFWDMGNTITVVLTYDTGDLESLDEGLVLAGRNAAWLGNADGNDGEIIQFTTATMTAANTYQLSGLLRGRLGTEHAIGSHGTNEKFVLLDLGSIKRSVFTAADWNKTRHFKPVSVLTALADATAQTFINTGEAKKPLSSVHVVGTRDSSNNLTVTWIPRTRIPGYFLGAGAVPVGEATEEYEVDFMSGASVVRTETVTSPTVSYSAADQTSDGLTPGNPVTLRIYKMSAAIGRGRVKEATV